MSAVLLKKSKTDSLNELDVPTYTESGTRRAQDVSIAANATEYFTNDLDVVGSDTYVGKSNGTDWLVQKITESGDDLTMRYATVLNNITRTTYALAWANRATLTYVEK